MTEEVDCPYCAEKINGKAKKCKHCGEILDVTMRELEFLKLQKKDVFINNSASSSTSASAASSNQMNGGEMIWPSTAMATWTLVLGIITFILSVGAAGQETVTEDDFFGVFVLMTITLLLGAIVLSTKRHGTTRAIIGIIIAIFRLRTR